jgi:hypothetical protein
LFPTPSIRTAFNLPKFCFRKCGIAKTSVIQRIGSIG